MTEGRFADKGVIVTGGAQGIGRAIVEAFVAEGAHVVAVDILGTKLDAIRTPGTIDTVQADLGHVEEVRTVVGRSLELLGRLDVLVNCAAVQPDGPALDVSPQEFDLAIGVNARAPFILMQDAVRIFTAAGGGAIVNIASANAIRNESPESIYNASKAALIAITTAFAHEFAHLGIRVNAVAPGETVTPEAEAEATPQDLVVEREYLARIPMRRVGRPHEQAAAVLFLASDDASFITGRTLVVDGGELSGDWFDRRNAPPLPDQVVSAVDDDAARAWVGEELVRLMAIDSPSHREHDAVAALEATCVRLGLPVARMPVPGAADDLVVAWGAAPPELLLNAHVDTIEPSWDRSGTPAIRDGKVHGLGAIDDKGGVMACLLGLVLAREAGADLDAGLVALGFTVDEEQGGTGSIVMAEQLRPRRVVVAEGTHLQVGVSEAGCVDVWLRLHGVSVHGALRDEGVNAAETAVRMVTELLDLPMTKLRHPRHGANVPMLWQIRSGDPLNVVPDFAELHVDVRVVPGTSARELCEEVAATAARYDAELEIVEVAEPFEGPDDGVLATRILAASTRVRGLAPELCGMQAWTDAHSFVELSGSEAVVFGPGALREAHDPGEAVEIDEVVTCARVFAELILDTVAAERVGASG